MKDIGKVFSFFQCFRGFLLDGFVENEDFVVFGGIDYSYYFNCFGLDRKKVYIFFLGRKMFNVVNKIY